MPEYDEKDKKALERVRESKSLILSKYFDMYINHFKAKSNIDRFALDYLLKKYWFDGTVAAFNPRNNKSLGIACFAPYVIQEYGMYNQPVRINLINTRNVKGIFPEAAQVIGKNAVVGYANKSHRPFKAIIDWYAERIAKVNNLIDNNLALQNMPFMLQANTKNIAKVKKILRRIQDGELVCYADADVADMFDILQTEAPYLVNELYRYKQCLDNEVLTILGVNNTPVEKKERVVTDEVNSNNAQIQIHDLMIKESLNEFFDEIFNVLGVKIDIEDIYEAVHKESNKEAEANESK